MDRRRFLSRLGLATGTLAAVPLLDAYGRNPVGAEPYRFVEWKSDQSMTLGLYFDLTKLAYDDPWYGYLWQQNSSWTFNKQLQRFKEPLTNRWMFTECRLSR